jgi:hypothetical protein
LILIIITTSIDINLMMSHYCCRQAGCLGAELENTVFAQPDDTGAQQTAQTYQSTQGAEERDAKEGEEDEHHPFAECTCPVPELFGRVYSDFGRWLDKDGKVLAFPRPPPPCQLGSLDEL